MRNVPKLLKFDSIHKMFIRDNRSTALFYIIQFLRNEDELTEWEAIQIRRLDELLTEPNYEILIDEYIEMFYLSDKYRDNLLHFIDGFINHQIILMDIFNDSDFK